jgi:hypothetical protein
MDALKIESLAGSVEALERRCRRQSRLIAGLFLVCAALLLGQTVFRTRADEAGAGKILRVRGLSVVDDKGTERIFIGAPVREPLILGKRFPRGGPMSGILLFDEDGTERSGYCTSDGYPNVLFTLDAIGKQHALFMAEPQGGTSLWVWNGGSSFKLGVDEEGTNLKLKGDGKTLFEIPAPKGAAK